MNNNIKFKQGYDMAKRSYLRGGIKELKHDYKVATSIREDYKDSYDYGVIAYCKEILKLEKGNNYE